MGLLPPACWGACPHLPAQATVSETGHLCQCGLGLVAQTVENLPAVQETWVQSQGRKDPLEKEMAPHSSILAWKIPWTEQPGGLQ